MVPSIEDTSEFKAALSCLTDKVGTSELSRDQRKVRRTIVGPLVVSSGYNVYPDA